MADEEGGYKLHYFPKKKVLDHCPRKTRCKIKAACAHVRGRYARKNPWTGRTLRKRIRGYLRHDCDTWEANKRRRKAAAEEEMTTLIWRDYHKKRFVVRVRTSVLRDHGISKIEEPAIGFGGYWSVYSIGAKRAVKVNVVSTEAGENIERKERKVYPVAERHKVGPKIYDWFHVREPDVVVNAEREIRHRDGEGRKKVFRYVTFALVEKFDGPVNDDIKEMRGYGVMLDKMYERVGDMRDLHGIKVGDLKDENYLVKVVEGTLKRLVVGDWGSTNQERYHRTYDCADH